MGIVDGVLSAGAGIGTEVGCEINGGMIRGASLSNGSPPRSSGGAGQTNRDVDVEDSIEEGPSCLRG